MAYLSADGYDYDIFVSYAHVDDQPMPGAAQGWVTTFANCIKTKLAQKLGRNDAYALWMDYELRGGQPITPHILDKLQRSAMLFVVLSPGYLKSVWCQRELDTFAGLVANGQARSVFVVELEPHDEAELPRPLADLKRSPFWTKDKKTGNPHRLGELVQDADEYYSAIDDFVREVVTDLKQPKRAGGGGDAGNSNGSGRQWCGVSRRGDRRSRRAAQQRQALPRPGRHRRAAEGWLPARAERLSPGGQRRSRRGRPVRPAVERRRRETAAGFAGRPRRVPAAAGSLARQAGSALAQRRNRRQGDRATLANARCSMRRACAPKGSRISSARSGGASTSGEISRSARCRPMLWFSSTWIRPTGRWPSSSAR